MSKKKQRPVKLHFTERALADLVAIETYSVEQHGKRVANRYLSDIEARLRAYVADKKASMPDAFG